MDQQQDQFAKLRQEMVDRQLAGRGITDHRVLAAMAEVPRHRFVSEDLWDIAYRDSPLPLGYGQTVSQPYIVAYMIQALHLPGGGEVKVLEIGAGSGYQAAILSRIVTQVYSVERLPELAEQARQHLADLHYDNVEIKVGDGGYGWEEHSPYDGIIVAAAAPEIPAPLRAQLKEGAALVAPIGPMGKQELVRFWRRNHDMVLEYLAPVAFVPLIGEHGWSERSDD